MNPDTPARPAATTVLALPGEAGSDEAPSLLEFPTDFPLKIMGRSVEGFTEAMVAIVLEHAPDFDPATLETRPSRGGNYLALTATINATSREQLDRIYLALTGHPMVKVVL